jgi:hypothetical protein
MSRLYDRIMRDADKEMTELLTPLQVILANNAAAYVGSQSENVEAWKNYPTLAPPFTYTWIEAQKQPNYQIGQIDAWGVALISTSGDFAKEYWHDFIDGELQGASRNRDPKFIQDYKDYLLQFYHLDQMYWGVFVDLFFEIKGVIYQNEYRTFLALDEFGKRVQEVTPCFFQGRGYLERAERQLWSEQGIDPNWMARQPLEQRVSKKVLPSTMDTHVYPMLNPLFMAINLLHCKNVELIEETPPPKLSKSHEKKYGIPLVTYKTLKVNSMRREYENDERPSNPGILKSLHICRGHFKDYRNGGGLFGKLEGLYWWDQHIRGDAKKGVVIKDYDVQAPSDN